MIKKAKLLSCACAVTAVFAFGSPALAGEITGGGPDGQKVIPIGERANSICAFSGLEDGNGTGVGPGATQTFGGELRAFADVYPGGVSGLARDGIIKTGPGTACRGN